MEKTVKDCKKLGNILNSLTPNAAKLLAYLVFTETFNVPFKLTYFKMTLLSGVANPHRAMAAIISKGYVSKKKIHRNECKYTLLVDLIK